MTQTIFVVLGFRAYEGPTILGIHNNWGAAMQRKTVCEIADEAEAPHEFYEIYIERWELDESRETHDKRTAETNAETD